MSSDYNMVSVCMITYNHESYVRSAIEGVLMQKCNFDFELVIGEDCSTDNTRQICEAYIEKSNVIRLLPSSSNLGVSYNFIRTLRCCSGRYIAFCEGDDYWTDPFKLQKQVDFLEANAEYGLVHTGFAIHDLNDKEIFLFNKKMPVGNVFFETQKRSVASTLTTVMRGEIVQKLIERAQNENLWFIIDVWLWNQCAINWKIHFIPEITAVYHSHPGGITKNKEFFKLKLPLIDLDVCHSYLKSGKTTTFKEKFILSTTFFRAFLAILRAGKGAPYRKNAFSLCRENKWLIMGIFPALYAKVKSRIKRLDFAE